MMHQRLRNHLLGRWSDLICRWPKSVLLIAAVAAVISVGITVDRLGFQSDRNALLSMELRWNRNFENWRRRFPGNEDFYVVVDAAAAGAVEGPDGLARACAFIDELGPALEDLASVEAVVWGFDANAFSPKAVRLLAMDQFEARLEQITASRLLLESHSPQQLIGAVAASMRSAGDRGGDERISRSIEDLTRLVDGIGRVLSEDPSNRPALAQLVEHGDQPPRAQREYLVSESGRLLFVRVTPRKDPGALNAMGESIEAVRRTIEQVRLRHVGVEAGLTGIDVVEGDETDAAARDSTIASLIASVLITLMLIVAYQSWRIPLLAMVALLTGIAWTFGFLTLAVGHLQVLSLVFAVILLGLGIAFGIHLASCLELVRHDHDDDREGFAAAMRQSFQTAGPGVVTGAVTTAAAFGTTALTDFRGVAEMGLIAAAGILLCLLAMFSVFPALLCLLASRRAHHVAMQSRRVHLFDPSWVMPFVRRCGLTLCAGGVLTGLSLLAATRMTFDYDLLKLQPRGVASVQWQDRITRDGGQSIWSAVSVVGSIAEARERAQAFERLASVGRVAGIGLLFPPDEREKLDRIARRRKVLEPALTAAKDPQAFDGDRGDDATAQGDLVTVLSAMRLAMAAVAGQQMPATIRQALESLGRSIDRVVELDRRLGGEQRSVRRAQLNREYRHWRRAVARQVDAALDSTPLTVADFPEPLLAPYVATDGNGFALEVHPMLPEDGGVDGPLNPKFLPGFVDDLAAIDPDITGVIVQIYRSGHLILRSYQKAGLYALAVVLVLVWIDFRSVRTAVMSLVPVAVGFAVTFGVMWVASVPVNAANIIVLPLMFGIGVDSGVHLLHRFRQDPHSRPLGLGGGTGKGITITSLTTMIGFGAMMFARHRGIASLGFVMATGIGLTMLACWTVVPAWLERRSRA